MQSNYVELIFKLQKIPKESNNYGKTLQVLARIGSLEWIDSIRETFQFTDLVKQREFKLIKEIDDLSKSIFMFENK